MALHLIKLCVGCESVEDLEAWIGQRIEDKRRGGEPNEHFHTTRMLPSRAGEIVGNGSLYWIIKGKVQCRQRLTEVRPFFDGDGISRCHLVLDPTVVRTQWQPRRPFQGWRYLQAEEAPPDIGSDLSAVWAMPPKLRHELAELGLL